MTRKFLKIADQLTGNGEPYVMAFVVNRRIPSSGKPGDKAIITRSGELKGWIGGGCTRGIVLKEAAEALQEGTPRLVRITPEGETEEVAGVKTYRMTCHSGGMVELYLEPVMPSPTILIMGKSHVAMALSTIAQAMGNPVTVVAKGADDHEFPGANILDAYDDDLVSGGTYVVVCTQGENDEVALLQAAHSSARYLGFVASRKKANAVFNYLRDHGISMDRLKQIRTPAGLDINAKTPHEVAVSILAEIIQTFRSESDSNAPSHPTGVAIDNDNIYINPVCGVHVEKANAKYVIEYGEEKVYFCCDGCKVQFEADPEKYIELAG